VAQQVYGRYRHCGLDPQSPHKQGGLRVKPAMTPARQRSQNIYNHFTVGEKPVLFFPPISEVLKSLFYFFHPFQKF
jgi:hypothetical protein